MNQQSPYNTEFQEFAKELKAKGDLVGVVCVFIGQEKAVPEGIPFKLWIEFAGAPVFTPDLVTVVLAAAARIVENGSPDSSSLGKPN